jgi:hypothetical protein
VEQDVTTSDRLHAIQAQRAVAVPTPAPGTADAQAFAARIERESWAVPPTTTELDALRAELLSTKPRMAAFVLTWHDTTATSYSDWDPGLFEPVDRERRDLERARDAGVLSTAEFAELSALLDDQARRHVVRHEWEFGDQRTIVEGTRNYFLGSGTEPRTAETRDDYANRWVRNVVRQARPPWRDIQPSWFELPWWGRGSPDIWLDPKRAATAPATPAPAVTPAPATPPRVTPPR